MVTQPQPAGASASASTSGGIGVLGVIQAVLIIGKFIDADWNKIYDLSWVWVFTPVYVGFGITALVLLFVAVIALFVMVFGK